MPRCTNNKFTCLFFKQRQGFATKPQTGIYKLKYPTPQNVIFQATIATICRFFLLHLYSGYVLPVKNRSFTFELALYNLLNQYYELSATKPMPQRYVQLGVQYQFLAPLFAN